MPKLYEYFGLIILFYSKEHEPIHVHGRFQNRESKAEIIIQNGKIIDIRIVNVKGKLPLDRTELGRFNKLVTVYKEDIVQKWIDFFVLHKTVDPEKITKEIK